MLKRNLIIEKTDSYTVRVKFNGLLMGCGNTVEEAIDNLNEIKNHLYPNVEFDFNYVYDVYGILRKFYFLKSHKTFMDKMGWVKKDYHDYLEHRKFLTPEQYDLFKINFDEVWQEMQSYQK